MAYVIVYYWPFLAIAAGLGVLVGWWATGSRRGVVTIDAAREDAIR
jgi:hypothetical protein